MDGDHGKDKDIVMHEGGQFKQVHSVYLQSAGQAKQQLDTLAKAISKLSSPDDSHDFRADLNNKMETVKHDMDALKLLLLSLEQTCRSEHEQTITASVGAELQAMLSRFQDLQRQAKSSFQTFIVNANKIKAHEEDIMDPSEKSPLIINDPESSHNQQIQQQVLQEEIDYNEQLLEERERGIREIEATMMDVREIFRDLGLLVSEQQFGIDNIEANIESIASHTKEARDELDRANEYRRRRAWTTYSFFMFLLILLVVLFVVLMV